MSKSFTLADALRESKDSGFGAGDQKALISIENAVPVEQEKQRKAAEQRAREKDREALGLDPETPNPETPKKKTPKSKKETEGK